MREQIWCSKPSLGKLTGLIVACAVIAFPALLWADEGCRLAFSDQDEIKLGKVLTPRFESMYGGVAAASTPESKRVRKLGQALARMSGRKGVPLTFKVLKDNRVPNAFAAPGGSIYITRKLIGMLDNDAELAYILGHEAGHVDARHTAKMFEEWQKMNRLVHAAGGGQIDAATRRDIADAAFGPMSLTFSRQNEIDADLTGVRWMSRLGYDPAQAVRILEKLPVKFGSKDLLSRYFSSHPAPEVRQQVICQVIRDENLQEVAKAFGTKSGPASSGDGRDEDVSIVTISKPPAFHAGETASTDWGLVVAE